MSLYVCVSVNMCESVCQGAPVSTVVLQCSCDTFMELVSACVRACMWGCDSVCLCHRCLYACFPPPSLSPARSLSVGARQLPKPGLGTIYPQAEKENFNLPEPPSSDPSPLPPWLGGHRNAARQLPSPRGAPTSAAPQRPRRVEKMEIWVAPEPSSGGGLAAPPSRPLEFSSSWPCSPTYGAGGWGGVCMRSAWPWGLGRPEE